MPWHRARVGVFSVSSPSQANAADRRALAGVLYRAQGARLMWDTEPPHSRVVTSWSATLAMDRDRELGFARLNGTVRAVVKDTRITCLQIRPMPDRQASTDVSGLNRR